MLTQNIIYDSDCYIKEGGNTNAQSKAANFFQITSDIGRRLPTNVIQNQTKHQSPELSSNVTHQNL